MQAVPAFVVIDEVKFPLVVDGGHVRVADDPRFPGLAALSYVAGHFIARTSSARVAELTQRQSLRHQALSASFIEPDDRDDLGDGVENWTRLAGRPPDLDDAYFVGTTWIRGALVMPRRTLIRLVEQVGALVDAVAAHRLEARIGGHPEAGPANPPDVEGDALGDHAEFVAIFVRSLETDRVEHHEVFESTGMSADALAAKISARTDELHDRFGVDSHDVAWESYSSLRAMHREHPELGSVESLQALLEST
jgi:hypothetical protein